MKPSKDIQAIALSFALNQGYDSIGFERIWNDLFVYQIWKKEDEGACIGYPTFIIIENQRARFATSEETLNIMDIHPVDPKDYKGEFIV